LKNFSQFLTEKSEDIHMIIADTIKHHPAEHRQKHADEAAKRLKDLNPNFDAKKFHERIGTKYSE